MLPLSFSQLISHPSWDAVDAAPPFITGANRKSLLVLRSGRAAIKANAVSRQLIRRGEPAFLSHFQVFISDFPLFLSGSAAKPVAVLEAAENISILLPNPLNIGIGGWRRRSSWEERTFLFFFWKGRERSNVRKKTKPFSPVS